MGFWFHFCACPGTRCHFLLKTEGGKASHSDQARPCTGLRPQTPSFLDMSLGQVGAGVASCPGARQEKQGPLAPNPALPGVPGPVVSLAGPQPPSGTTPALWLLVRAQGKALPTQAEVRPHRRVQVCTAWKPQAHSQAPDAAHGGSSGRPDRTRPSGVPGSGTVCQPLILRVWAQEERKAGGVVGHCPSRQAGRRPGQLLFCLGCQVGRPLSRH